MPNSLVSARENARMSIDNGYTGITLDAGTYEPIFTGANINNVTYSERDNIFEVDPDLAEYLLDTIRQFERPMRR